MLENATRKFSRKGLSCETETISTLETLAVNPGKRVSRRFADSAANRLFANIDEATSSASGLLLIIYVIL
jgi:hypothetical protein